MCELRIFYFSEKMYLFSILKENILEISILSSFSSLKNIFLLFEQNPNLYVSPLTGQNVAHNLF